MSRRPPISTLSYTRFPYTTLFRSMLQAWQTIYPSTLEPYTAMSADLMSHVRYPTDLLKVQRAMLGVYHVDDARSFIQQDNRWATPNDPQNEDRLQPPYRSEERRVGKESVSTCRSRRSPYT